MAVTGVILLFLSVFVPVVSGETCYYHAEGNIFAVRSMECSTGCCGDYSDRYCCTNVGLIVGIVITLLIVITTTVIIICCCCKKKTTHGVVVAPQHRDQNIAVISTQNTMQQQQMMMQPQPMMMQPQPMMMQPSYGYAPMQPQQQQQNVVVM